MATQQNKSALEVMPRDEAKIKKIWKTAGILLLLTLVEFVFAFTLPRGFLLYFIFIALTIWKAKYIMMEFMHLGEEAKPLFYSIIVPLIFLVWLVIALVKEGSDIFIMRW
ncbi:cytochrome C oxidase subunit IV family protein [Aquiflexum sp. LQ15W]|uniref:cytochrome C oxidase subunit IV family protein n=1 Tax=Cognataquiflexum nitidum TaxID=2922272 RepID=UPI001F12D903|nr:cytochrome C oxidase subunit IV family protein [Cognataquiflexum nitidum]MCH6200376.1 cytochrome C oxidase subunit IV family protein [Cognataquiflexum nitidum]